MKTWICWSVCCASSAGRRSRRRGMTARRTCPSSLMRRSTILVGYCCTSVGSRRTRDICWHAHARRSASIWPMRVWLFCCFCFVCLWLVGWCWLCVFVLGLVWFVCVFLCGCCLWCVFLV